MFDPTIGQFVNEDPIEFDAGDPNLRRFVGNHPTDAIDPTGLAEQGTQLTEQEQTWRWHPLFWYFDTVRNNRSSLERRDTRLGEVVGKVDEEGRFRIGFVVEKRESVPAPEETPWYWTRASGVYREHRFVPRGVYWAPAAESYNQETIETQRRFADENLTVELDNTAIEIALDSTEALYDFTIDLASLSLGRVGGVGRLSREVLLDHRLTPEAVAAAGFSTIVARAVPVGERLEGVQANKLAGDRIRDAITGSEGRSLTEQVFQTIGGARRVDVLKTGNRTKAIESKLGRTSLDGPARQELARDWWLRRQGQLDAVEWVFSRSPVTGEIGPTGPLLDKLQKLGFQVRTFEPTWPAMSSVGRQTANVLNAGVTNARER